MTNLKPLGLLLIASTAALAAPEGKHFRADAPMTCAACDEWNAPHEPFRVFGNTYYVGVAGLSAVLIASEDGLILLDAGLPQSAPLIDASIRKLGLRTEDIRLIVNSHAHFDHAGGIAALQRASGARVAASASCDILLTVHPAFASLDEKLRRRQQASADGGDPFVDQEACRAYAADAARRLDARVEEERRSLPR